MNENEPPIDVKQLVNDVLEAHQQRVATFAKFDKFHHFYMVKPLQERLALCEEHPDTPITHCSCGHQEDSASDIDAILAYQEKNLTTTCQTSITPHFQEASATMVACKKMFAALGHDTLARLLTSLQQLEKDHLKLFRERQVCVQRYHRALCIEELKGELSSPLHREMQVLSKRLSDLQEEINDVMSELNFEFKQSLY